MPIRVTRFPAATAVSAAQTMTTAQGRGAPKFVLGAAVVLLAATTLLAAVARRTDIGATRLAQPVGGPTVDLRFEDRERGTILVTDVTGRLPARLLTVAEAGFVRVTLRSMARERQAVGHGQTVPFRLGRSGEGRLWILDPTTGRLLYLDAHGHENTRSFARLLEPHQTRSR